jgi:hypothetical protein
MAVLGRWRRMLLAGSLLTALLRPRAYHPRKGSYPAWSRKPPMATKTPARAYSQRGAPHFSEVKTGKNHCAARALQMIPPGVTLNLWGGRNAFAWNPSRTDPGVTLNLWGGRNRVCELSR